MFNLNIQVSIWVTILTNVCFKTQREITFIGEKFALWHSLWNNHNKNRIDEILFMISSKLCKCKLMQHDILNFLKHLCHTF